MPFKKSATPKTTRLICRITAADKEWLQGKADNCGLSVSEYVLRAALGRQTRTRHDVHVINELRAINATLREIYHGAPARRPEELRPVLEAVVRAIERVGAGGIGS